MILVCWPNCLTINAKRFFFCCDCRLFCTLFYFCNLLRKRLVLVFLHLLDHLGPIFNVPWDLRRSVAGGKGLNLHHHLANAASQFERDEAALTQQEHRSFSSSSPWSCGGVVPSAAQPFFFFFVGLFGECSQGISCVERKECTARLARPSLSLSLCASKRKKYFFFSQQRPNSKCLQRHCDGTPQAPRCPKPGRVRHISVHYVMFLFS